MAARAQSMEGLYMKAGVHTMRRIQPFVDGILHIYPVADKSCYGMITQQKYIADTNIL